MSIRTRTPSTKQPSSDTDEMQSPRQSLGQRALSQTLASTAHLSNLLPTGTVLAFQMLTPIFSNNGNCDPATGLITQILLTILAVSCFLACFTDSFKSSDGNLYYGFATLRGMWLFDYPVDTSVPDLRKYRLRFADVLHAFLSVFVFTAIALRDKNVVSCFYSTPGKQTKEVLDALPVGVGLICSMLFVLFPSRRHGIGFPISASN